jgi:hypothetical protein
MWASLHTAIWRSRCGQHSSALENTTQSYDYLQPSYLAPSTSSLQYKEGISQGEMSGKSHWQRQRYTSLSCLSAFISKHGPQQSTYTTSIHVLDDDSLLNIFDLHRPFLLSEEQDVNIRLRGGVRWVGERWWYRLAHVCQKWRNLILGSASYLGLCLVCTYGTRVADMLVHSPPLPLIIDHPGGDITTKDEEEIFLALEQRDRVRRIQFKIPVLKLSCRDSSWPSTGNIQFWNT